MYCGYSVSVSACCMCVCENEKVQTHRTMHTQGIRGAIAKKTNQRCTIQAGSHLDNKNLCPKPDSPIEHHETSHSLSEPVSSSVKWEELDPIISKDFSPSFYDYTCNFSLFVSLYYLGWIKGYYIILLYTV